MTPALTSPKPGPTRHARLIARLLLPLCLLTAATSGGAPVAWYVVRTGDSLGKIARLLGVKVEELRRDNPADAGTLQVGRRLRVGEALRDLREHDLRWRRPLGVRLGPVQRAFGTYRGRWGGHVPHTGVDVATPLGATVHAPATGVVRYCGPQDGFGTVIILEHACGWSSVLAPLQPDTTLCRAGQIVLRGDVLGRVGPPQEGPRPYLHIELRQGRQAVRPTRLLR